MTLREGELGLGTTQTDDRERMNAVREIAAMMTIAEELDRLNSQYGDEAMVGAVRRIVAWIETRYPLGRR